MSSLLFWGEFKGGNLKNCVHIVYCCSVFSVVLYEYSIHFFFWGGGGVDGGCWMFHVYFLESKNCTDNIYFI